MGGDTEGGGIRGGDSQEWGEGWRMDGGEMGHGGGGGGGVWGAEGALPRGNPHL